ncbi:hypothetical protein [Vibrio parahaemolyticus]|uniref:hypothetical protein n=1 Tax=Vibrio parahaemolyticus TaxID=670 RepID=UPI0004D5D0BA|nr:hypothetical protein [Vibrio parahaemolyticus]EJG0618266.1 hypothetical protein [Vibrio parahaemolyticus]EJG0636488.1 hypothetical protein [Vibrio parahaemolyticus]EJG0686019.1 hypothetical protein [Vibrio parahaemolyticus]EJG0699228.1 hypothetical protein [Vibrio parahaemolyticus]EJG0726538.1 hypothetical protein [Vibrio parahaemolyticus]
MTKKNEQLATAEQQEDVIFTFGDVAKITRENNFHHFYINNPNGETHRGDSISVFAALSAVKSMIPDAAFNAGFESQ